MEIVKGKLMSYRSRGKDPWAVAKRKKCDKKTSNDVLFVQCQTLCSGGDGSTRRFETLPRNRVGDIKNC